MPKRIPTDAEILAYNNVPVAVAAAYLGCGPVVVQSALKQRCAPYGYAVENKDTHTWKYQVSPGALVKFKNGDLHEFPLDELVGQIANKIDTIVSLRTRAAVKVLSDDT